MSKSIEGEKMKLDTLIEGNEGKCIMQEPLPYGQYLWSSFPNVCN